MKYRKKPVLERFKDIKELEVADGLGTVADFLPYFCKNVDEALQRLEAIDNAKPSEALKYVNGKIADLEDDLQHYTMVDKDKCREFFIREDLKQFDTIKQALLKAQEQEKENAKYKKLEEEIGYPLDEAIDLLLKEFSKTDDYRCLTCTNPIRGINYGCDGNCQHKDNYTKKEIIDLIRKNQER